VVVEPLGAAVVAAPVDVNHHVEVVVAGVARAGAGDAGVHERGELGPVLPVVLVDLAERPENAGGHLVADLDHVNGCALPGEVAHDVARVGAHGRGEGGQVLSLPRGRGRLLAGVGPEVGVVQVQQDLHARLVRALGQREGRSLGAVAGRRVGPDPQAHVVGPVLGQDLLDRADLAPVRILSADRLLLQGEGHVGAADA
jgi:hypothetical protein